MIYRTVIHRTDVHGTKSHRADTHSSDRAAHGTDLYEGEYTRRRIKDQQGRCFELIRREDGTESLKEMDAEACAD